MATKVIGGATAQAWLDSGASELIADPATFPGGDHAGKYSTNNITTAEATAIFDAADRDVLNSGTFGIGVDNPFGTDGTFVHNGQFTGISSQPSEIGYYTAANGGDQADTLDIKLDGALSNATATVSFFYGAEESGEQLTYELYLNGVKVGEETVSSGNGLSYSPSEPGYYTFDLDGFTGDVKVFDEVRFSGALSVVNDASDFLLENITGTTAEGLSAGYWKTHTSVWDQSTENGDVPQSVLAGGLTLQEVVGLNGGGEQALARQAVAALININSDAVDDYPMTQSELITEVNAALVSNDKVAIAALTVELNAYNTLETDWVGV
jgi:hypothetical protein